ncbi:MAG TPA: hypothetical protein VFU43_24440 [Streptosporangiaceae bacterium]|nr:hypothetical protein [Streptosporangiaceae bacterium]
MSRLILLGNGTADSLRFAPVGLLLEYGHIRVGIDGGPGSEPPENIDAWLVRDEHGPLRAELLRIARETGMPEPAVLPYQHGPLKIEPVPVADHVYGYRIGVGHHVAGWLPEAATLPAWADGLDLAFADGSLDDARTHELAHAAKRLRVRRLVFVRLGAAALAAVDAGAAPPYGEWGDEGRTYRM